jgi:hypothetical protein
MEGDDNTSTDPIDARPKQPGVYTPDTPAKRGEDHARHIRLAMDDFLDKNPEPGWTTLDLRIEVNPGSVKEYRLVPRSA